MDKKQMLVLYHGDLCLDGFASAAVIYNWMNDPDNPGLTEQYDVVYQPISYGDPIPDLTNQTVYIVDFSFDPEELVKAARVADSVLLLDHHAAAYDKWREYIYHKAVKETV